MMDYRRKNGRCNPPDRKVVDRVLHEVAAERNLPVHAVATGRRRGNLPARVEAWSRILAETGCSINGLAEVWGIDRQAIWRPLFKGKTSTAKSNSCGSLWITPLEQIADRVE